MFVKSLKKFGLLVSTLSLFMVGCNANAPQTIEKQAKPEIPSSGRPNILLIVADDMGYTDLGLYGGEIRTPNIDALGRSGILMTDFYASMTCSPARAMLLTGMDNHLVGLGNMSETVADNQIGLPGYEGYLNNRALTLAELLKESDYHTYMAGKWHLGSSHEQSARARGFERSFSLLHGAGSHFDDAKS